MTELRIKVILTLVHCFLIWKRPMASKSILLLTLFLTGQFERHVSKNIQAEHSDF